MVRESSLGCEAGLGCFASHASSPESLVALYPGVLIPSHLTGMVLQFISTNNGYLMSRKDGSILDADASTPASLALLQSTLGRDGIKSLGGGVGLAVGHLVNHSKSRANVRAVDVIYDRQDCGANLVPVVVFGASGGASNQIPGIALYSTKCIQEGEELFLDYAFTSDSSFWPDWYTKSQ